MQNWLKFSILFLTGFLSCVPTLWGTFLFDDGEAVVKNVVVSQPTKYPWTGVFTRDFWGVNISHPNSHKSYRPLTVLTYRWDFQIWGLNPFPFHLENLIIHGLNCGLIYFFLTKCLQIGSSSRERQSEGMKSNLAFWASMLFSVHPIHVEPLGGVVGRADLLSSLVFICGFLLLPENNGWMSCFLATLLSIIGSLFKETAITLAIFHISLQFAVNDRFRLSREKFTQYTLSLVAIGLFIIWRLWFQSGPPVFQVFDNPPAFATSYFTKVSSILYVWGMNAFILLNPIWLCYDWSGDCIRLIDSVWTDIRFISIVIFICVSFGLLVKSLQNRVILVALLLFGTTFLPSSNLIFTVGFVLAERNLYLPSIGFSLLIAYVILEKGSVQILMYVLLVLMAKSIHRSFQWENQAILFKSGAFVCPNNSKIHYNLGSMYADAGNLEDSEKSYKYAIKLRSDYYQAMNNLGNLLKSKDINESEYWLRNAVHLKPDFAAAWMNLGIVLAKRNQSEALICYQNALKFRKIYPDCLYNLGNLYLDMGNRNEALECWTRATSLKPEHVQSWINRVILLEQQDKLEDAKNIALEGLQAVSNCDTLHFLLGNILGKVSNFEKAELHFIKAIDISSQFGRQIPSKYFSNLGVLYHRWGRNEQAIESYNNALRADPNSESVKKYLRSLRTLMKK